MTGYIGYESEYDLGGINSIEDSSTGIVRNNLIHYLDAANINSYPGTGTTALDISGQGFTGTLVGTISFNSNNKGFFNFTGAASTNLTLGTDFNSFSPTATGGLYCDSATRFSVSIWYKWVISPTVWGSANHSHTFFSRSLGIGTGAQITIFGSINTYTTSGEPLIFGRAALNLRGALTNISPTPINDEIWHNSCITWDGTTARAYFDGLFYRNAFVGTAGVQSLSGSAAALGANSGTPSANQLLQGSVSQSLVYDRALSDAEVLQNYNAIRGRYGR
jgi:hypothetical protein